MDTRLNGMREFLRDCRPAWAPEFSVRNAPTGANVEGGMCPPDLHFGLYSVYGEPPGLTGANGEGGAMHQGPPFQLTK